MQKLNKFQWTQRIEAFSHSLPKPGPDDLTLLQMLTDVIVSEQTRLKHENLAVLAGMAAALLERFKQQMKPAKQMTTDGEPVYSEADVAAQLGISVEQLRQHAAEMAKEMPNEDLFRNVDPSTLHRVN